MKKVFMVHGFMGAPNGGWRPWLMGELYVSGVYACALPMPNPYEPKLEEWVGTLKWSIPEPNAEIYLIGHSLGVPTILRYLEVLPEGVKIGGALLISGPHSKLEIDNPESKIRRIDNFLETGFDFEKIKSVCPKFVVIHSDDDPKVPFIHAEFISRNLGCELVMIKGGGHLSGKEGWDKFPEVLNTLESIFTP